MKRADDDDFSLAVFCAMDIMTHRVVYSGDSHRLAAEAFGPGTICFWAETEAAAKEKCLCRVRWMNDYRPSGTAA